MQLIMISKRPYEKLLRCSKADMTSKVNFGHSKIPTTLNPQFLRLTFYSIEYRVKFMQLLNLTIGFYHQAHQALAHTIMQKKNLKFSPIQAKVQL